MHIRTIRVKEIVMSREEHEKFLLLMQRAADGHMSHSASDTLSDGSLLQITINDQLDEEIKAKSAKRKGNGWYEPKPTRNNGY